MIGKWRIGLIWAQARDGAIGRRGALPWHLPEDLAHFRQVTLGSPVIMGRRTWESLPEQFRPLPGRENIVVSRNEAFHAEGARVVPSIRDATRALGDPPPVRSDGDAADPPTAWVIGGGELYRVAMPFADVLEVTTVDLEVPDADTFAPEIGTGWQQLPTESSSWLESKTGQRYRFESF